ncbi:MAG: multidrug effflux MFS transporter [Rhodobacteraceae bacterium]|nr:multidrug effflux MFS transporter [Paracoccaceae bacterium]
MTAARTPPHLATLIVLTAVSLLTLNMFIPSLVNIARDFEADYALVSLAVAGYLGVTAVLQLVIGPLSDLYGRRPVLLICLVVFALASIGCFLAQDIWVFLACRMVQGAVIAASALPRAIVRDMRPPQEAVSMLGYISMAMAAGPMLAPMVGGFLDAAFGWRAIFALLSVAGLGLVLLTWADLGETNTARSASFRAQLAGYGVLLRSGVFWGYSACMSFAIGAFFVFVTGAPLVAHSAYGMGPAMLGVVTGSITGGFFFGSWLSGRFSKRFHIDSSMLAGRLLGTAGLSLGLVLALFEVSHPLALFGTTVFVGIGNGISSPSSSVGAMSVRDDLAGTASGLSGAMVVAVGAVLTWITGMVVSVQPTPLTLLVVMWSATVISLLCALYVVVVNRATPSVA